MTELETIAEGYGVPKDELPGCAVESRVSYDDARDRADASSPSWRPKVEDERRDGNI